MEVAGKFIFDEGSVKFQFGGMSVSFSEINSIEDLRGVLLGIAGHQLFAQKAEPQAPVQGPMEKAKQAMDDVLAKSERTFREYQRKTAEALKQAEKDYEAATVL